LRVMSAENTSIATFSSMVRTAPSPMSTWITPG
jgi:hypothetical protein